MIRISGLQVGRTVHYVLPNDSKWQVPGRHVAAMITRVHNGSTGDGKVNLTLFVDRADYVFADAELGDLRWLVGVPYDPETKAPGTWHFLEAED